MGISRQATITNCKLSDLGNIMPKSEYRMEDENIEKNHHEHGPEASQYNDEELTLTDIALILLRYKYIIISFFVFGIILGAFGYLMKTPTYSYYVNLEIGKIFPLTDLNKDNIAFKPLEERSSILAKLKDVYIPGALYSSKNAKNNKKNKLNIKVEMPRKSNIVKIETRTKPENEKHARSTLEKIALRLVEDHNVKQLFFLRIPLEKMLEKTRMELKRLSEPSYIKSKVENYKNQIIKMQHSIKQLENDKKLILFRIENISKKEAILRRKLDYLTRHIASADSLRRKSIAEVKDEAHAMTLLLLNNEIRHNQAQKTKTEEQLYIEIPEQRERLQKSLEDIDRKIKRLMSSIKSAKLQIEKITADYKHDLEHARWRITIIEKQLKNIDALKTRLVAPPMRSLDPVGLKPVHYALAGPLFGMFAGIMLAFMLEFASRIKARMKAEKS